MSSLGKLHEVWLRDLRALNRSGETIQGYEVDWRNFRGYLFGAGLKEEVKVLTPQTLKDWRVWMSEPRVVRGKMQAGLAPGTIARRLSMMASFCNWLALRGDLAADPCLRLERPKMPSRLPRPVATIIATKLEELADVRERAALSLLHYAGLRITEATDLDVEDIGKSALRVRGKGAKERTVPLFPPARRALDSWLTVRGSRPGALFLPAGQEKGSRMRPRTVRTALHRLLREAEIVTRAPITPHSFRHSFASELAAQGIPLQYISMWMGHSDLNTTQKYQKLHSLDGVRFVEATGMWGQTESGKQGSNYCQSPVAVAPEPQR